MKKFTSKKAALDFIGKSEEQITFAIELIKTSEISDATRYGKKVARMQFEIGKAREFAESGRR